MSGGMFVVALITHTDTRWTEFCTSQEHLLYFSNNFRIRFEPAKDLYDPESAGSLRELFRRGRKAQDRSVALLQSLFQVQPTSEYRCQVLKQDIWGIQQGI